MASDKRLLRHTRPWHFWTHRRANGRTPTSAGARAGSRSDGPPRLVLRFAILTAVGLALAAGGILLAVRHVTTSEAHRAATSHAQLVADAVLRGKLTPSDFEGPVAGARRAELDDLFEDIVANGVLLVKLIAHDGTVTYSSDPRLVGLSEDTEGRLADVFDGAVVSDVTRTYLGVREDAETLRAYVPIPFGLRQQPGAMALYQDYGPIADAAQQAFFPIAGILEVALVGLYLTLFPILRRVTKRIRRQVEEIEHLAFHDELTELPNRTLFRDRVEQALVAARREGYEIAVLLIDLDRFKEINDALGHKSGDLLLQDLTTRLRGVLREHETFARLGGDEFALLVPHNTPETVQEVVARLRAALDQPFVVQGLPIAVEASIGVAIYPTSGDDVDELIQRADVAMYLAKESKSGHAVYSAEDDPNDPERLSIVSELRAAIEKRQLILHFQPKADLRTGAILGVEALLRWEHPVRGLLPPSEFVPQAERTGLIKPLSAYVVEAALRQWRAWQDAGIRVHVAVNVTVPNLLDVDFTNDVTRLLRRWDVDPGSLQLEITESTLMADPFRARQVLAGLSQEGVRFAIDDFGTGYSSLAYLKRLPVSEIKIDRSFVVNMDNDANDATIVRSTIDLGRNLGLRVVAEGVETQETWDVLAALGCDFAQGYLVGRPVAPEELTERLLRPKAPAGSEGGGRLYAIPVAGTRVQ